MQWTVCRPALIINIIFCFLWFFSSHCVWCCLNGAHTQICAVLSRHTPILCAIRSFGLNQCTTLCRHRRRIIRVRKMLRVRMWNEGKFERTACNWLRKICSPDATLATTRETRKEQEENRREFPQQFEFWKDFCAHHSLQKLWLWFGSCRTFMFTLCIVAACRVFCRIYMHSLNTYGGPFPNRIQFTWRCLLFDFFFVFGCDWKQAIFRKIWEAPGTLRFS